MAAFLKYIYNLSLSGHLGHLRRRPRWPLSSLATFGAKVATLAGSVSIGAVLGLIRQLPKPAAGRAILL